MPTDPAARAHPTAVFYGDSIVTGWRGTTAPRRRWTSRVSDELGWRDTVLAVDGMGYYRRRGPRVAGERTPSATDTTVLDAALRLEPDVLVVCLGANDIQYLPQRAEQVRAGVERDLGRIRARLPTTPVVVTDYYPVADLSERARTIHHWIVESCHTHGHTYAEAFRLAIDGDEALLCDDRVHPNDAGHAALAAAVLPVLRLAAGGG